MIDGSKKRNRRLAFELKNSYVCEKRSNEVVLKPPAGFAEREKKLY